MILPTTTLVVPDGAGRIALRSAAWRWCDLDDVRAPVAVVRQDGSPYELTDLTIASLAFWESDLDGFPQLQIDFSIDDGPAGLAHFDYVGGMLLPGDYSVGARFYDAATARRDAVLAPSRLAVSKSLATQDASPTPPTPSLAPTIGHVDSFADLPDPAEKAWRFYSTDDDGALYFSNGSVWTYVVEGPVT